MTQKDGVIQLVVDAGGTHKLHADALLVAAGRTPRTQHLQLEKAGVKVGKKDWPQITISEPHVAIYTQPVTSL